MPLGEDPNQFKGQVNEKNILLHAVNRLYNKKGFAGHGQLFNGVEGKTEKTFIEAVMDSTHLFERANSSMRGYRLNAAAIKMIFERGVEFTVDTDIETRNKPLLPEINDTEFKVLNFYNSFIRPISQVESNELYNLSIFDSESDYQDTITNLCNVKKLLYGGYGFDTQITPKGIRTIENYEFSHKAVTNYLKSERVEKKKEIVTMTLQEIEKYKLAAFKQFEEYGIGKEAVWMNIANKAGIPKECQDDIKNIMYHQRYMYKTTAAQGIGDLVKSLPSITAAKYDLQENVTQQITNINTNTTTYGDFSPVVTGTQIAGDMKKEVAEESMESKYIAREGLKLSKRTLLWTIIGIVSAIIIGWLTLR